MKILKVIISLVFLSSLTYAMHSERPDMPPTENAKPATIKVLLKKDCEGVLLEVRGPYQVFNPHNDKKIGMGLRGKRFYAHPQKTGVKWGEDYPGIFQIRVIPTSPNTSLLLDGIHYRGAIELYHIEGKLSVVNEVDIESYLKSILTPYFPKKLPSAVMDSIAIVARTDAYYYSMTNHDVFWHVDAKEVGYDGYASTLLNLAVDRSVDNTRYLIMTYEEQPFASTWNKNCAGKTASFQSIFRKTTSSPNGVHSNFALKDREEHRWFFEIDAQELAQIAKTNRITGIDLYVDSQSNKVYALKVKDGIHSEEIDFLTLQKGLGSDRLLSNDFSVTLKGNRLIFDGYGEGCGVGLCIYSAAQMAERGDYAPKILAEFYPHTTLEKMREFPSLIITATSDFFIAPQKRKNNH